MWVCRKGWRLERKGVKRIKVWLWNWSRKGWESSVGRIFPHGCVCISSGGTLQLCAGVCCHQDMFHWLLFTTRARPHRVAPPARCLYGAIFNTTHSAKESTMHTTTVVYSSTLERLGWKWVSWVILHDGEPGWLQFNVQCTDICIFGLTYNWVQCECVLLLRFGLL